ncbi:mediator of RNA polymerase II transcription subunit 30-like isoform X2 [Cimex lectularius]|uniref:Mediator of RNA polymerase II transcription subunit 30 n=1 Tax=Cimex lectularius TaxID=79782 RepID=A0A8I6SUD4_CIMLE|nr:mediator of RNA polymerase II transcription subunit 30-like isoform X2 [Cimex lectularius]
MSGPPHSFQTSFANAQRNERAMRSQFVGAGGPQIPGLMANQQAAMVAQQGYGGGVVGMQQPLSQQQQQLQLQQQQLQMQQQQQLQMQQQQQQVVGEVPQAQPPPQQAQKELNTVTLCRYGQEAVQDIVSRTQDLFQALKVLQPPNGTTQGTNASNEKKAKIQEQLKFLKLLFKRLRLIYERCNESCQLQGMEYMHIESLIPLKEEWDMKSEEKKTSELYRVACDDSKEIIEQVIQKNRQLKEVIEHLRRIIWEINTMLTMRRS